MKPNHDGDGEEFDVGGEYTYLVLGKGSWHGHIEKSSMIQKNMTP